jgi:Helix-turn-helix domain
LGITLTRAFIGQGDSSRSTLILAGQVRNLRNPVVTLECRPRRRREIKPINLGAKSSELNMKSSLLNPKEAATVLRMDSRTLIRWARLGYVPAHPLGEGKRKLWRFLEHELLDWVEARESDKKRPPASTIEVAISAHARRSA